MTEQNNSQQGIRFLVIAAALVIIVWGINQAQSVMVSFLVAVFFAISEVIEIRLLFLQMFKLY